MIEEAHEATAELIDALQRLLPQLSSSADQLDLQAVKRIVDSEASRLLVARDPAGRIVGTLTLVIFPIPTGTRAWIEDVIVDSDTRGQGVGQALTNEALKIASQEGARTVDLTSRPSRETANRMYERIGFTARESRIYRYTP